MGGLTLGEGLAWGAGGGIFAYKRKLMQGQLMLSNYFFFHLESEAKHSVLALPQNSGNILVSGWSTFRRGIFFEI